MKRVNDGDRSRLGPCDGLLPGPCRPEWHPESPVRGRLILAESAFGPACHHERSVISESLWTDIGAGSLLEAGFSRLSLG